jgi:hypothetical protein
VQHQVQRLLPPLNGSPCLLAPGLYSCQGPSTGEVCRGFPSGGPLHWGHNDRAVCPLARTCWSKRSLARRHSGDSHKSPDTGETQTICRQAARLPAGVFRGTGGEIGRRLVPRRGSVWQAGCDTWQPPYPPFKMGPDTTWLPGWSLIQPSLDYHLVQLNVSQLGQESENTV